MQAPAPRRGIPKEIWRALREEAFLTIPQAARLLGCDWRTVRNAIRRGEMPATKVGTQWRIPTVWLRQQVRPPERPAA